MKGQRKKKYSMKMVTVSDQINFYPKTVTGDKAGHNNNKSFNSPEHVTVINIYIPNIRAPKYIKQTFTETREKYIVTH